MGNNVHYTVKGVEVRVESTALSSLGIVRMWTAQQALRIDVNLCKKPGSDSCQAGPLLQHACILLLHSQLPIL